MAFRQLLLVEPGTEWPTHFAWTPRRIYTASLWHRSTGPYNHDLFKRLGFSRRSRWVWKSIATGANGQKEDSVMQLPSFPCKFDRAVIVAQWYNIRLETLETWNPAYLKRFGQAWQALVTWLPHQYPCTLCEADLCYQEALDWRKWTLKENAASFESFQRSLPQGYAIRNTFNFQADFKPRYLIIIRVSKNSCKTKQLQCWTISDWKLYWWEMVDQWFHQHFKAYLGVHWR